MMIETPMGPNEIVLAGRLCVLEILMQQVLKGRARNQPDPAAFLTAELGIVRTYLQSGAIWGAVAQIDDVRAATSRSLDHLYQQAINGLVLDDMERRSTTGDAGHA